MSRSGWNPSSSTETALDHPHRRPRQGTTISITLGPDDTAAGKVCPKQPTRTSGAVPACSRRSFGETAAVWFAVAILACLALLAIADYQRDPEDWKRHRILYVGMIAAAVVVTIVAGVISSGD